MVTSYYIMQMSTNYERSFELEHYYSKLKPSQKNVYMNIEHKCRICLQEGKKSISANKEITQVLRNLADVQVSEYDAKPRFLCEMCYKFVKIAILFRQTAKDSEATLAQFFIESTPDIENFEYADVNDSDNEKEQGSHGSGIMQKKEKKTKITCNFCHKVINRSYYKEHVTMHNPDHKKFVCEKCGKSFRLRCAYYNHKLRHRDDFPYKCQMCPYRGRYRELLKNHMRTHTGDYRYMCAECPARFLFKSNLNRHVLKHKKPQFQCDTCKRAFHRKLQLERHFEAEHLGIKNHVCQMCGKAFGYRNAMMKHQRSVHKREKMLFGRMPSYLQAQQKSLGQ